MFCYLGPVFLIVDSTFNIQEMYFFFCFFLFHLFFPSLSPPSPFPSLFLKPLYWDDKFWKWNLFTSRAWIFLWNQILWPPICVSLTLFDGKKMSPRGKEWLEGDRLAGMVFCWLICLPLIKFSDREENYHWTQIVV